MATKYVTLKDSNGDTLYPQAVATNLAPGSIDATEIADGAVTAEKMGTNAFLKRNIAAGDANNIKETGLYYLAGVTANAPDANSQIYQAIVIIAGGAGAEYGHQIFINLWNNNTYIRRVENGTWSAWRQFTVS